MTADQRALEDDHLVVEVNRNQVQHFTSADPRCRALQLPEGIMLRYTLSQALYFYLRTRINDGKITTTVFASDSPYDRQKTGIGEVRTPLFETGAELNHLRKVERLLRAWVEFVKDAPDAQQAFQSFAVDDRPD